MIDLVLFYVFAGLAVASALVVAGQRNPMLSAFSLIVTFCSLSAIYGLLGSPFIAALQVIVYAGAIMVLFLFVLMLLSVKAEAEGPRRTLAVAGGVLVLLLVVQVGSALLQADVFHAPSGYEASTTGMAQLLFSSRFLYVFEATSILILSALVGAVVLAKKDL
jgi:NADH-quinone oxidoreductase subunit J